MFFICGQHVLVHCIISAGLAKNYIEYCAIVFAHSKNDLIYFKLFIPSGWFFSRANFSGCDALYQIIMNNYLNKCFFFGFCFERHAVSLLQMWMYFDCKSLSNDFASACQRARGFALFRLQFADKHNIIMLRSNGIENYTLFVMRISRWKERNKWNNKNNTNKNPPKNTYNSFQCVPLCVISFMMMLLNNSIHLNPYNLLDQWKQ